MAIMRLGRVEVRCPNWEKSIDYYKRVIGLIETAREEDRVYLKAWDEHDHHSVILKKADSAGLEHLAFKCEFASDLDLYEQKLNNIWDLYRTCTGRNSNSRRRSSSFHFAYWTNR